MPGQYETNLSDEAWEVVKFIITNDKAGSKRGRPRKYEFRSIIDAIFYLVKNGCTWRNLPNDFPPWKIVYNYFRNWSLSGTLELLNEALVCIARISAGREDSPSLASIDSQSQTAEPGIEERGLDGNKKINGRKRHIAVDIIGLILVCFYTAANESDRVSGEKIAEKLNDSNHFPRIKKILGDNAYCGVGKEQNIPVTVEASERKEGQKGFVPEAFRWVVERTFAWLNRQRRLARNYEKSVRHQESMTYIANIRLCIKRYEKWLQMAI
jgi:putative transposase